MHFENQVNKEKSIPDTTGEDIGPMKMRGTKDGSKG